MRSSIVTALVVLLLPTTGIRALGALSVKPLAIEGGPITGDEHDGVRAYKGIPFASDGKILWQQGESGETIERSSEERRKP